MALQRRRLDLSAEYSLIERNRQIQAQVAAIDAKLRMPADVNSNNCIAGRTAQYARLALTFQPDLLAFLNSRGNGDFQPLTGGEAHHHAAALHRIDEWDFHGRGDVRAARRCLRTPLRAPAGTAGTASTESAEQIGQEIRGVDVGRTGASAAAERIAAAEMEFEMFGLPRSAGAGPAEAPGEAVKAGVAGFPLGIDLAAVEVSAFLLVPENFVGRIHLGKFRLCLGIVFVLIGMMFLSEAAECLLNLAGARRPGDAQDLIGIAHLYLCPQSPNVSTRQRRGHTCLKKICGEARTMRKRRRKLLPARRATAQRAPSTQSRARPPRISCDRRAIPGGTISIVEASDSRAANRYEIAA